MGRKEERQEVTFNVSGISKVLCYHPVLIINHTDF